MKTLRAFPADLRNRAEGNKGLANRNDWTDSLRGSRLSRFDFLLPSSLSRLNDLTQRSADLPPQFAGRDATIRPTGKPTYEFHPLRIARRGGAYTSCASTTRNFLCSK